jgi:hypothetical protein
MNQACLKWCEEVCGTEICRRALKIAEVGWSLIFIWTGIAILGGIALGFGLVGVGLILLGMQAFRKYYGLDLEVFWLVSGTSLILGGLWLLESDGHIVLSSLWDAFARQRL